MTTTQTVVAPDRHRGRPPSPCGTPGAYRRHLRYGERPCGPCIRAISATRVSCSDRAAFEASVAGGVMVSRPELAVLPMFGAAHYAGLVMGA